MTDEIELRTATPEELPRVAEFWVAMFEEIGILSESEFVPEWKANFVRYFTDRGARDEARFFVATENGAIAGTAGALIADGYPSVIHGVRFGYVFGVRVDPAYRNRGLATTLTRAAVTFLREKRCKRIRLHASPFGRRIYERMGFEPTNEMALPAG